MTAVTAVPALRWVCAFYFSFFPQSDFRCSLVLTDVCISFVGFRKFIIFISLKWSSFVCEREREEGREGGREREIECVRLLGSQRRVRNYLLIFLENPQYTISWSTFTLQTTYLSCRCRSYFDTPRWVNVIIIMAIKSGRRCTRKAESR